MERDETITDEFIVVDSAVDKCDTLSFNLTPTQHSDWECFLFGNKPDGAGMVYIPRADQVPNRFIRFMMKICLDCTWIKKVNGG